MLRKEFQVDGAETEREREEKWLVTPVGIDRRYVLEERRVRARTYGEISSDK